MILDTGKFKKKSEYLVILTCCYIIYIHTLSHNKNPLSFISLNNSPRECDSSLILDNKSTTKELNVKTYGFVF